MPSATATRTKAPGPKHNIEAMREEYYQRISKHDMTPLWKVMDSVVTKEPVTRCAPVIWHFDDIKRLVMELGGLITAEEANRRVLILENPALRGQSKATNTLFAGVQMILPGEVAPAHRHVSSAIRFVLDGEGAYTAVEGEKSFMSPGDFVITANWAPHDHGNTSKQPMLWLDVLDFPQVNFFEASFAEQFESATQPTSRGDGDSLAFYGSGVLPDGSPARPNSQPRHQLHLCAHPPDHRAHGEGRRHRQAPRRARALRQSDQRRPGAADHGRQPRAVAEGLQGRALPRDRRHHLRLRRRAGHAPRSTARCWTGARGTCSWCRRGRVTRTAPPRSRCCSRSPTGPRRRRSASGARTRRQGALAAQRRTHRAWRPGSEAPATPRKCRAIRYACALARSRAAGGRPPAAPRRPRCPRS